MALNIASYNLRGFRSGFNTLKDISQNHSIIAVQEHWLRSDELDKLSLINKNFNFSGFSGMNKAASCRLLAGRPFGGVACWSTLWWSCSTMARISESSHAAN